MSSKNKIDEHLWLSLKMAPIFVAEITEKISTLDPKNSEVYKKNSSVYIEKIQSLNSKLEKIVAEAKKDPNSGSNSTLLFADRFPFKYLMEDYGLNHCEAFPGCSAESEASFYTIVSLSETIDTLDLSSVIVLKKSKTNLAKTIIENSGKDNVNILILDSMQSVTSLDIKNGLTYLNAMENNMKAIAAALNVDISNI